MNQNKKPPPLYAAFLDLCRELRTLKVTPDMPLVLGELFAERIWKHEPTEHEPALDEIRRILEQRETPCENDEPLVPCPGWRIDEADGDPQMHKLGDLFIARCDACVGDKLYDDDVARLPEAQTELARCKFIAMGKAAEAAGGTLGMPASKLLPTISAASHDPVRKVAVTILLETDAPLARITEVVRKTLDDADNFSYQLSAGEVRS